MGNDLERKEGQRGCREGAGKYAILHGEMVSFL